MKKLKRNLKIAFALWLIISILLQVVPISIEYTSGEEAYRTSIKFNEGWLSPVVRMVLPPAYQYKLDQEKKHYDLDIWSEPNVWSLEVRIYYILDGNWDLEAKGSEQHNISLQKIPPSAGFFTHSPKLF